MVAKYRCWFCKHLEVEYEVIRAMRDDVVSNAQWRCSKRDDERCVRACREFEDRMTA